MRTILIKTAHRTSSKLAFSWGYFDAAVTKAKGGGVSDETRARITLYSRDRLYANGYFAGLRYDGNSSVAKAKEEAWTRFLAILRDPALLEKIILTP